jgi:tetratricopeptide (TPR) repeat protein
MKILVAWLLGSAVAFAQPAPADRHLVIPFENANREGRLYWLSEGSAVVLTDDLLALGAQVITREDRLRAFERLHVPPVATLSHATVIRLGQLVGATRVIVGSFELRDSQLTVRARAIRLDTGRMQGEIVERGPLNDLFGVYGRIARSLVPDTKVSAEAMQQAHPPLAAFEQYIKGVLAENPATALGFLDEALELYPPFQRIRLAQWAVHTEQGDHKRALEAVRPVPADHRLSRRARFLGAVSMIHLGQYEEAFEVLRALNEAGRDPAVLNNLGVVQLRRPAGAPGGRPTYFFSEASKADPEDSDVFFNLGYAYWVEKDVQAAIYWLREAVRRNPADHEAHYALGVALQASGTNTAEAAREKELAHQLSSTYAELEAKQPSANVMPRGLERIKTDVDVPASLRVESVLVASEQREQQELATFHLERGRRLFQAERDTEAIAELRRTVYLAPYQNEAHLLLGRIYLRTGRVHDAIDALKISLWSADSVEARLALAEAYLQAKDEAAARREVEAVLKRDPLNAEARRLMEKLKVP